jgi:hypothetical protein
MRCSDGIIGLVLIVFGVSTAPADVCAVPSAPHPTIQAAVDDVTCTEIVLVAQVIAESVTVSRSLVMRGGSSSATAISGQVTVTGDSTEVALQDLRLDGSGCAPVALDVTGGAQVTTQQDVVVVNTTDGQCPIFANGFESGDSQGWSTVGP